jgi:hypothetical protein
MLGEEVNAGMITLEPKAPAASEDQVGTLE